MLGSKQNHREKKLFMEYLEMNGGVFPSHCYNAAPLNSASFLDCSVHFEEHLEKKRFIKDILVVLIVAPLYQISLSCSILPA